MGIARKAEIARFGLTNLFNRDWGGDQCRGCNSTLIDFRRDSLLFVTRVSLAIQ